MSPVKTDIRNRTQTDGYNALMYSVRTDDIRHDPWGTGMGWLFALAEVVYVESGEILPEFVPSPLLRTRNDLEPDSTATDVFEMLDSGTFTLADMCAVFAVLSRYVDWCRQAGRSY